MADLTQEEFLALARNARVQIPEEDLEHLNLRYNVLTEALDDALGRHRLEEVLALPARPHPVELPSQPDGAGPPPPLPTETEAPLAYKPVTELAHLIRTRQLSPVDLVELYLQRIGEYDGVLRSYITVTPEIARQEAREAERRLTTGEELGPLHGVPLGYKDEFYTQGVRTTCGSLILSEFVPDYDATAVARLHQAGAVMLGK